MWLGYFPFWFPLVFLHVRTRTSSHSNRKESKCILNVQHPPYRVMVPHPSITPENIEQPFSQSFCYSSICRGSRLKILTTYWSYFVSVVRLPYHDFSQFTGRFVTLEAKGAPKANLKIWSVCSEAVFNCKSLTIAALCISLSLSQK